MTSFHCSNPPATITWYKDNEVFKDQGAFVYPFEGEEFQYHSGTINTFVLISSNKKIKSLTRSKLKLALIFLNFKNPTVNNHCLRNIHGKQEQFSLNEHDDGSQWCLQMSSY